MQSKLVYLEKMVTAGNMRWDFLIFSLLFMQFAKKKNSL